MATWISRGWRAQVLAGVLTVTDDRITYNLDQMSGTIAFESSTQARELARALDEAATKAEAWKREQADQCVSG